MIHRRSLPDPVLPQGACHREVQHVKSVQALTGQNISDMIRDVAGTLADYVGIEGYRVTVENFESIHNHSAWAVIDRLN